MVATLSLLTLTSCSPQTNSSNTGGPSPNSMNTATTNPHNGHGGKGKMININTGILSELDKLEAKLGVPALSNKIQSSRPYGNIEELVSKNVINQAQFEQIKDLVTIENIELTGEAKDVDYMIKLALMKGHLIVAKELLDINKPEQAEPHIGHPIEEIYVDIEDQLKERNVPDFKETLIKVQDFVKSKPKDPQLGKEFSSGMVSIDKAIESLSMQQRTSPKFILQVINGILDTANSEYGAAMANGQITAAIEYQDSRGFVQYAKDTLYPLIKTEMAQKTPEINQKIQTDLAALYKAWPQVIPPANPVLTPAEVSAKIKAIEGNTVKLITAN